MSTVPTTFQKAGFFLFFFGKVLASSLLANSLKLNHQNVKTNLIEAFFRYDSPRRGALHSNGNHGYKDPKEIRNHNDHLCSATDLSNGNRFEEMQDGEFGKGKGEDIK